MGRSINLDVDTLENFLRDPNDTNSLIKFEEGLAVLSDSGDPKIIRPLLFLLDDSSPFNEVMFSIIHAVEDFDDEIYVSCVLRELDGLYSKCPKWAKILLIRIINLDSSSLLLKKELNAMPMDERRNAINILEGIKTQNDLLRARISSLLN